MDDGDDLTTSDADLAVMDIYIYIDIYIYLFIHIYIYIKIYIAILRLLRRWRGRGCCRGEEADGEHCDGGAAHTTVTI